MRKILLQSFTSCQRSIKRAADTKQNSKNKSNIDEEYEWMIQVADRYTIPDEGIK